MSKRPFLLLYINDFTGSPVVQAMNDSQRVWYLWLLMMAWQNEKKPCHLPNDDAKLMMLATCKSKTRWDKYKGLVLDCFDVTEDDKWISNQRLIAEYEKMCVISDKRAEAARVKAAKRLQNSANAQQMQTDAEQNAATQTLTLTPTQTLTKPKSKPASRSAKPRDPRFEPIREHIEKCCKHAGVPFVWDASEATHLSNWLKATPNIIAPVETCIEYVKNRFRLAREPGERPRKWIGDLGKFAGATNGTNQPTSSVGKHQAVRDHNAEAAASLRRSFGIIRANEEPIREAGGRAERPPMAGSVIEVPPGDC